MLLEICRIIEALSSFVFKHAICFNRIWSTIKTHSVFYVFNKKHTCTSKIDCMKGSNTPIYVSHITRSCRTPFVLRSLTPPVEGWDPLEGELRLSTLPAQHLCSLGLWAGSTRARAQFLWEKCSNTVLSQSIPVINSSNYLSKKAGISVLSERGWPSGQFKGFHLSWNAGVLLEYEPQGKFQSPEGFKVWERMLVPLKCLHGVSNAECL